jgi:hypothetical protein
MKGNFLKGFFENSKVVIEVNHHKKYLLYKENKKMLEGLPTAMFSTSSFFPNLLTPLLLKMGFNDFNVADPFYVLC